MKGPTPHHHHHRKEEPRAAHHTETVTLRAAAAAAHRPVKPRTITAIRLGAPRYHFRQHHRPIHIALAMRSTEVIIRDSLTLLDLTVTRLHRQHDLRHRTQCIILARAILRVLHPLAPERINRMGPTIARSRHARLGKLDN
jgi:hypothetical protein